MIKTYSPQIWKKQNTILVSLPYNDFDHSASQHFREMITALILKYKCKCLIIDFSSVMLIDGTGLASLVFCYNTCSSNNVKLIISSLRQNLYELMNKKGVLSLVEFYDGIHDALDSATKYSSLDEAHAKSTKSLESVFGDPFEEDIIY